jgi:hypothetical protein
MGSIEQRAAQGVTAQPDATLDQVLDRLGLAGAKPADQRRAVGELAYGGRLPLAWLKVLRQADFLPYDENRPEEH